MNKTVLCIVDGLGIRDNDNGNAVAKANMVNLNGAMKSGLYTQIKASGPEVGLVDEKDPGNSEVGHNAIGSGQYIKQGLALLNEAFKTGDIYKSDGWKDLSANAKKTKLNIIFLLSDGNTHSSLPHLFYVLEQCAKEKITVSIHALADGRDVAPQSVLEYIDLTREKIKQLGLNAKIATVGGRGKLYMDRYESNVNLYIDGIRVCALGQAPVITDIHDAVSAEYKKNSTMTDETLNPYILEPKMLIENGDSVLLLNYRGDRAVGTCKMFESGKFLTKEQYVAINKCHFAGIMQYDADGNLPKKFLCPPPVIKNGLTGWLCKHNVRQYSVTETVKFGHLTYFFNGNRAAPYDEKLENWKEFTSDVCNNMYNGAPKMQTEKICDDAISAIKSGKYDFIKMNFPNPDMVGHTADFDATVIACKTVDECLGKLIETCKKENATLVITADHGNAEFMKSPDGKPNSNHTNALVPFVVLSPDKKLKTRGGNFGLTNIASTVCVLLGVPPSPVFNESIII
ncbi:MAG: 2,3-bisphosphoglycerate-independent phosphoglycerate mutase [Christensenellaceae bacterium]|jgi:2,3-bisphosphoglycerate-independent phosphoglycerate mutase|nr:2,3-bisphosphoglycerate-independent phosphoglycerate mutase [Christensenellaceae bacterium]